MRVWFAIIVAFFSALSMGNIINLSDSSKNISSFQVETVTSVEIIFVLLFLYIVYKVWSSYMRS